METTLNSFLLTRGAGFALKYAELKPLVCESYADAVALRDSQATPILLQVRSDVTRYRYGDEQHLDEALLRIFRINKSGGIRRNQTPVLARLREQVVDGKYALILGFTSTLPSSEWEVRIKCETLPLFWVLIYLLLESQTRVSKFDSFFGPGVVSNLVQTSDGVDVQLISDGTSAGGLKVRPFPHVSLIADVSIQSDEEVLPPLLPGLAPRVVKKNS